MSTEENKAIVRRFVEAGYNEGNFDAWDDICVADLALGWPPNSDLTNLEVLKQSISRDRMGFPDLQAVIDDMIAEENKVVARITYHGTNTGQWGKFPPTGKPVSTTSVIIFRLAEGKIVEAWYNTDLLGVFIQLGYELVPPKDESEG